MSDQNASTDAGLLREQLAAELATWREAKWFPSARALRWHRRVASLAKLVGASRERVLDDLRADAEIIAAPGRTVQSQSSGSARPEPSCDHAVDGREKGRAT